MRVTLISGRRRSGRSTRLVKETLEICQGRIVIVCSWFARARGTTERTLAHLAAAGRASAIHHIGGSRAILRGGLEGDFPFGSIICLDDADTMLDTGLLDAIFAVADRNEHELVLVTTSDDDVNVHTFFEHSLERLWQRIRNAEQARTPDLPESFRGVLAATEV